MANKIEKPKTMKNPQDFFRILPSKGNKAKRMSMQKQENSIRKLFCAQQAKRGKTYPYSK